jgi:hypothetical protein
MKTRLIIFLVSLAFVATPLAQTGCSTAPSARVVQAQTLRTVGETAKATMQTAATLLKQGQITVKQYQAIAQFYDLRFQPAYGFAVDATKSELSVASPDMVALLGELIALVNTFTPQTK